MNNSGELRALIDIGEIREYNYDDFSNIKPIAKGGYGAVFSAIFKPKGITIALKKLSNLDSDKKEFVKEVRHLRKVDHHPYINQLLGITQEPEHMHYVMVLEYANGGNLHDFLRNSFENNEYKLKFEEQICFAKDIADGLRFLHKENIIHRDLHSKNVLIHNQKVMIADLGISKLCNDDATRTGTGELKCTIAYLEPQCILDLKYERDFKSDIYSLGVLYWELTTGKSPFQNATARQILLNISHDLREDPNPITPIEYVNLYKRCWDLDPENRPQINEVYDIISNIMSETDKKFDEYILKTLKTEHCISGSNAIIASLFQEFIKLYIKDMDTNSDDAVNDINIWLKNNCNNSKEIFNFTMKFEDLEHRETVLAYFYTKGFGTNKDYKECLYWCKKGCEKKDVYSYYEAAFCYRYSLGTSEGYNEAFRYFNLAVGGGVLKAKRELAIMHMNGIGCEENKAKAVCLLKEAGEQDKIACGMISDCYYDGIGIEIDLIEALKYYKICWKKWECSRAIIRIPLIEAKLGIPIEQRCNLR